jgi:hypothetical protein
MRICPLSTILVPNPSSAHEAKSTKAEITKQTTTPSANDPISNNNFPYKTAIFKFLFERKTPIGETNRDESKRKRAVGTYAKANQIPRKSAVLSTLDHLIS